MWVWRETKRPDAGRQPVWTQCLLPLDMFIHFNTSPRQDWWAPRCFLLCCGSSALQLLDFDLYFPSTGPRPQHFSVTWLAATGIKLPVSICDLPPPRLFAWSPPRAPGARGNVLFCNVSYVTLIQIIRPRGRLASSHTAGRLSPRLAEILLR